LELKLFELQTAIEFAHEFESLFYAQDSRAMAAYYADDATLLAERTETLQSRESIEQFWRATCERAGREKMKRRIEVEDAVRSENLGYATGKVYLETSGVSDQAHKATIRYVTIWRRSTDGTWRIILDISNQQPAAQ
jgi:ketosteroid isomerase-like protein